MSTMRVWVEGVGLWSPPLGDFGALRAVLDGMAKAESASLGLTRDPYLHLNPLPEGEEAMVEGTRLDNSAYPHLNPLPEGEEAMVEGSRLDNSAYPHLNPLPEGEEAMVKGTRLDNSAYPHLNPLPEGEEAMVKSALLEKSGGGPAAAMLSSNERRRAPECVRLAVEVAGQAVAMSGRDPATMPCVFASAHGDQAITDYMCATLAQAPEQLSPTRFHHSVHNAPVGYWTIATGCHAPSTAVAAQRATFGAGLLEAVSHALAEQQAVLLVCSDTAGSGPLAEVTGCQQSFGCALVLAPAVSSTSMAALDLELLNDHIDTPLAEPLASWRGSNPSATSLALLATLSRGSGSCRLAVSAALGMQIDVRDLGPRPPE